MMDNRCNPKRFSIPPKRSTPHSHFAPRSSLFALRPSRRGFTLIELLVVVAIIALLVSILLPSLISARWQAKTVLCMSNARQIALGLHYYAQDYDDNLPVFCNVTLYRAPERVGFDGYWTDKLIAGPDRWNGGYLPEPKDKYWVNYGAYSDGVLRCPEVTDEVLSRGGAGFGGYGVNSIHVIKQKLFFGSDPTSRHTKLNKIKRQSQIWLVGDAQPTTFSYPPGNWYYGSGDNRVLCPAAIYDWLYVSGSEAGGRHNGGVRSGFHSDANICFVDGHVETWSWKECYENKQNLYAHDYGGSDPYHGAYK